MLCELIPTFHARLVEPPPFLDEAVADVLLVFRSEVAIHCDACVGCFVQIVHERLVVRPRLYRMRHIQTHNRLRVGGRARRALPHELSESRKPEMILLPPQRCRHCLVRATIAIPAFPAHGIDDGELVTMAFPGRCNDARKRCLMLSCVARRLRLAQPCDAPTGAVVGVSGSIC